jgi:hypothetical protein
LHGVVDRETRRHDAARAVDVHGDFALRIFRFKPQQLSAHQARQAILDRTGHEDDPLLEQPRENVERALPPARLFDDHGNKVHVTL